MKSQTQFFYLNKKVGRISLHKYVCARAYVCAANDNIEFTGLWIYFWILLLKIIFSLKKVRNQIIYKLSKYSYFVFFLIEIEKSIFIFQNHYLLLKFLLHSRYFISSLFFCFLRSINFLFLFLFVMLLHPSCWCVFACSTYTCPWMICVII